jgi:predicted ATP-dependent endonuclease of OLD family
VRKRVIPFLDILQKAAKAVPVGTEIDDLLANKVRPASVLTALFKWSTNRSQIKRIRVISEVVKSFNERRTLLMQPVQRYTKLVNAFLNDSGKSISFDDEGYVNVFIDGINDSKEISSLSSGEAQIFVILTQLSFNKSAQAANIFIIDEPELSLHVFWQELFVDSVLAANPNIQYVMATHSPSVILDKTKNCVDISQKKKRGSRGKILS